MKGKQIAFWTVVSLITTLAFVCAVGVLYWHFNPNGPIPAAQAAVQTEPFAEQFDEKITADTLKQQAEAIKQLTDDKAVLQMKLADAEAKQKAYAILAEMQLKHLPRRDEIIVCWSDGDRRHGETWIAKSDEDTIDAGCYEKVILKVTYSATGTPSFDDAKAY